MHSATHFFVGIGVNTLQIGKEGVAPFGGSRKGKSVVCLARASMAHLVVRVMCARKA